MNHGGDETGYIPKALDAQERFLWWEMDQAVIAIMLISMGVIAGSMLTGMVMGATAAWQYGRMKAGKASQVCRACPLLVVSERLVPEASRHATIRSTVLPGVGDALSKLLVRSGQRVAGNPLHADSPGRIGAGDPGGRHRRAEVDWQ